MENQTLPDFNKYLIPGNCIRLSCDGPERFNDTLGYVGEVGKDSFEFGIVTNAYEHFSNISADPILKNVMIKIADVKGIRE